MPRRALTWGLTLPLVGASVLVGHDLAYRTTGADPGSLHDYLQHAPQVLALLAAAGLVGLALDSRAGRVGSRSFALLGVLVFAVQEHVERLLHDGAVPLLLVDRAFLLGLALQVPVGLLAAWIARRLVHVLRAVGERPARPPLPWVLPLVVAPLALVLAPARVPPGSRGRGPPRSPRP